MLLFHSLYLLVILGAGLPVVYLSAVAYRSTHTRKAEAELHFFTAFTALLICTVLVEYSDTPSSGLGGQGQYVMYLAASCTAFFFLQTLISLAHDRMTQGEITGWRWVMALVSLGITLIQVLTTRVESGTIILQEDVITILRLIAAVQFMIIMIRSEVPRRHYSSRPRGERVLTFSCIPLIFLDISLQGLLPLRIFPFVYLAYCGLFLLGFTQPMERTSTVESATEPDSPLHPLWATLSEREQEIAADLLKGRTNKQISSERFISVPTVKTHAQNVYRKLGIHSRFELVAVVRQSGKSTSQP